MNKSFYCLLFFVFISLIITQNPLPPKSFPPVWYTWVVTSIVKVGVDKPLSDKGQLIAYDAVNGWTCRFLQQDLLNPTNTTPVDYCDYKSGTHLMLNDVTVNSTCAGIATISGSLSPITYPSDYLNTATFIGIDKVAQRTCNHFDALSVNIGDKTVQMDVWTDVDTQYPCQISLNDLTQSTITTFAFDGFNIFIPQSAVDQCSAAKIMCTEENWVCQVIPNTAPATLSAALSWVCDPTHLDCSPINPGGSHYYPNTLLDHCNWAFNAYFRLHRTVQGLSACSFGGIAQLVPPNTTRYHINNAGTDLIDILGQWIPNDISCARF